MQVFKNLLLIFFIAFLAYLNCICFIGFIGFIGFISVIGRLDTTCPGDSLYELRLCSSVNKGRHKVVAFATSNLALAVDG